MFSSICVQFLRITIVSCRTQLEFCWFPLFPDCIHCMRLLCAKILYHDTLSNCLWVFEQHNAPMELKWRRAAGMEPDRDVSDIWNMLCISREHNIWNKKHFYHLKTLNAIEIKIHPSPKKYPLQLIRATQFNRYVACVCFFLFVYVHIGVCESLRELFLIQYLMLNTFKYTHNSREYTYFIG